MRAKDRLVGLKGWWVIIILVALGLTAAACGGTTAGTVGPTMSPTIRPTLDRTATASAQRQVTLQARVTQNVAIQSTLSARRTEASSRPRPTNTASEPTATLESNVVLAPPVGFEWKTTIPLPFASSAPFELRGQQLIFHEGYVYVFGGLSASEDRHTQVYYSAINRDGTLRAWVETTPLPGRYDDHVVVKVGGFVYLLTGAAGSTDVYFAPLNGDGAVGTWERTSSWRESRQSFAAVGVGDFIITTGGNSGGTRGFVQVASIQADGRLNPWVSSAPLPAQVQEHAMVAINGRVYVIGGTDRFGARVTEVYYSEVRQNGSLGEWTTTASLPRGMRGHSVMAFDGIVYLLDGSSSIYSSRVLENGSLSRWQDAGLFPTDSMGLRVGAYEGYVYAVGGYDGVQYSQAVYYARIASERSTAVRLVEHQDCTNGWSRLEVGRQARVSSADPTPNRVRTDPDQGSEIIALIYSNHIVQVLEGPVCVGNFVYWKVASDAIPGGSGWTAEGDLKEYFLEPNLP